MNIDNIAVEILTSNPVSTDETLEFGGRTFTLLKLEYDSYIEFMGFLEPILSAVSRNFATAKGLKIPDALQQGPTLNTSNPALALLEFCKKDLPDMACIVLNQEAIQKGNDSSFVTADWIKQNAENPWVLCQIVLKQVNKNRLIADFATMFTQAYSIAGAVVAQSSPQSN